MTDESEAGLKFEAGMLYLKVLLGEDRREVVRGEELVEKRARLRDVRRLQLPQTRSLRLLRQPAGKQEGKPSNGPVAMAMGKWKLQG